MAIEGEDRLRLVVIQVEQAIRLDLNALVNTTTYRLGLRGCCTECEGTGQVGWAAVETGGRCWDCYGTGHTHTPTWRCLMQDDDDRLMIVHHKAIMEGYQMVNEYPADLNDELDMRL